MSDPSKYGFGNKLPDVPVFGEDHTPPLYTASAHHPPVPGYPSGYPSAASGTVYTGNTPTAAETGMNIVSGNQEGEE